MGSDTYADENEPEQQAPDAETAPPAETENTETAGTEPQTDVA
jgi:hypothetical protein